MPVMPIQITAPAVSPAKYGLLDTISPVTLAAHGGMAGVSYDAEFCGVARPWVAPCVEPASLGSISVSVDAAGIATVTGTGEPVGLFDIDWGDGQTDTGVALDGQTNTYAGPGPYEVTVTGPDGYRAVLIFTADVGVVSGPFVADAFDTKVADDGVEQVVGEPIPIYHLSSCRLVGSGDREARARRALDLGASRAVEQGFGSVIGAAATDITPSGTAVGAIEALALLEQAAGELYGGVPVIHASRDLVTWLISQNLIRDVGGHLETILGSLVIAGPGYADADGPSAPAAGASWMYATGAVNVWEDATILTGTVLNNPYDNQFYVLAERTYVPTYECFAVGVESLPEA